MPERRRRSIPGAAVALGLLGLFVLMALLAPLLANDKPILARVDGRMLTPALADLPLVGALFESRAGRLVSWDPPGPGVVTLLRPPVPYSYRGIRLEMALVPPSSTHLMGTDALGRDLLARLIHGSRASLAVGLMATTLALMLGTLLGLTAALRGGLVDLVLVRVADAVASFPPIVLALAFVAASGRNGLGPIVASIALSRWTAAARFVRGETLRHAYPILGRHPGGGAREPGHRVVAGSLPFGGASARPGVPLSRRRGGGRRRRASGRIPEVSRGFPESARRILQRPGVGIGM